MESSFNRQNQRRRIFLCGEGNDIRTLEETLNSTEADVRVLPSLGDVVEAIGRRFQAVVIAGREGTVGPEAAKCRLRLNSMPGVYTLALGAEASYDDPTDLVRTGVSGFVRCDTSIEALEKVLCCVENGELWISRRLLSGMIGSQPPTSASLLTRRELEILKRMASGSNNRQIAEALFVTRDTVRWHLRSAYAKLGVHDRNAVSELLWSGIDRDAAAANKVAARQSA